MYLSRLVVNRRSSAVRRDLADCQDLHRTLMRCFPAADGPARLAFGVLFRVEVQREGSARLLVQSAALPDWSRLPDHYLEVPTIEANPATGSLRNVLESIDAGRRFRFRLVANPTRSLDTFTAEGQRREKRVELRTPEDCYAWIERKGLLHGFKPVRCITAPVPAIGTAGPSKIHGKRQGQKLTVATMRFDGFLDVTDPALCRDALAHGIGRAKAYGCGLLSLSPA